MASKFAAWWQKIKQHWRAIVAVAIVFAVLIVLIVVGYRFDWTGFTRKTLWDWLQLLIIPLVLAVIALLFNLANSRTERQIAKQRYEQDQQIALGKQHEDLLQAYLDRISELLLKESLRTSPSEEVRNVARVRTITVLTQLDARRIGYVFTFLREAGLMSTTSNDSAVSLSDADLHSVNWSQAFLRGANLSGAFLEGANLTGANLRRANLSRAILFKANLSGAILNEANLSGADLSFVRLSNADLSKADLSGANLSNADLSGAILNEANLSNADLSKADLSSAKLFGADLSEAVLRRADLSRAALQRANLTRANLDGANLKLAYGITDDELEQAESLQEAIMPDGSLYI